mgnify:FL=1
MHGYLSDPATRLIRARRRTLSIRITQEGNLEIRAPLGMPKGEIEAFLKEKAQWIETHRAKVLAEYAQGQEAPLGEEEILALAEQMRQRLPEKLNRHAASMGVTFGRVTIRCQQTRWGSCSSRGNLNFNCLLMLAPEEVLDYVVVHELAHRKQMNHSALFWQEVARECPDYKKSLRWLKDRGGALLSRARAGKD